MVQGGADNRSFLKQRRKKRPKIFHGSRKKITEVRHCSCQLYVNYMSVACQLHAS